MDELIPVNEETLERVRSGKPLRDVGRIDLRDAPDDLMQDELKAACQEHRARIRYGHEAPIQVREVQMKNLVREAGLDPDDEENPLDVTAPGSRFMGHELWVEPKSDEASASAEVYGP